MCESGCCLGLNEQMDHRKIGSVLFVFVYLSEFQMYLIISQCHGYIITIIISYYYLFHYIFVV